jgi:hypothetical protein
MSGDASVLIDARELALILQGVESETVSCASRRSSSVRVKILESATVPLLNHPHERRDGAAQDDEDLRSRIAVLEAELARVQRGIIWPSVTSNFANAPIRDGLSWT